MTGLAASDNIQQVAKGLDGGPNINVRLTLAHYRRRTRGLRERLCSNSEYAHYFNSTAQPPAPRVQIEYITLKSLMLLPLGRVAALLQTHPAVIRLTQNYQCCPASRYDRELS
jgi:hypothetical protein